MPGICVRTKVSGGEQEMVGLLRTSRLAKVMHGTSFFEV